MNENKSSVSKETSYKNIGEYWDSHDLGEIETQEADFNVDIESETFYYPVETSLSSRINSIAAQKGISSETLINLWLSEKVDQEVTKK